MTKKNRFFRSVVGYSKFPFFWFLLTVLHGIFFYSFSLSKSFSSFFCFVRKRNQIQMVHNFNSRPKTKSIRWKIYFRNENKKRKHRKKRRWKLKTVVNTCLTLILNKNIYVKCMCEILLWKNANKMR